MGTVIEHNVETGEIVERPQTDAEIKQAEIDTQSLVAVAVKKIETEQAKQALLARLGITAEEAQLLLGSNE
jgi:hypothetical protein